MIFRLIIAIRDRTYPPAGVLEAADSTVADEAETSGWVSLVGDPESVEVVGEEVAVDAEVSADAGVDVPLPILFGVELAETFSEIGVDVPVPRLTSC